MSKIALLLPYSEMVAVAENAVMQMGLDINYIRAIKTGDAVNEARRAVAHGARIIVARTGDSLPNVTKKMNHLPVLFLIGMIPLDD